MSRLWIFAAVAVSLFTYQAKAETRTIYRSGLWSAFDGTTNDGTQVCGVVASGRDRSMGVKYFLGADRIVVHFVKNGWSIPRGTKIQMALRFSGETPWTINGVGYGEFIEFSLAGNNIEIFIKEFQRSSRGYIRFIDGNEEDWEINLLGSSAAVKVMTRCVGNLIASQNKPTQPFNNAPSASSQPFAPSNPSRDEPNLLPASPVGPGRNI